MIRGCHRLFFLSIYRSHLDLEQATIHACGRRQIAATPRPSRLRQRLTRGEPRGAPRPRPRRHRSASLPAQPQQRGVSRVKEKKKKGRNIRINNFILPPLSPSSRVHQIFSSPNLPQPLTPGKLVTHTPPRALRADRAASPTPYLQAGRGTRYPRLPHRPPPGRCGPRQRDTSSQRPPDSGQEAEHRHRPMGPAGDCSRTAPGLTERAEITYLRPSLLSPEQRRLPPRLPEPARA